MIVNIKNVKKLILIALMILIPFITIIIVNNRIHSAPEEKSMLPEQEKIDISIENEIALNLENEDFFPEYRIKRERLRGKKMELLQQVSANSSGDNENKDVALLKMVEISEKAEKEMQAEAMIKSIGVEDCVFILKKDYAMLIVQNEADLINEQEIKEAASLVAACEPNKISIISRQ